MSQCKGHLGYKTAEISLLCHNVCVFTVRSSYASADSGIVILSVRLSVCQSHVLVTKRKNIQLKF